jgi:glycosyltransferase involved in cell wall biosynthesis
MIKTSVIIAIYNRIDYLKLVLAGFERQSFKDFEIILADDGSTNESVKEIEEISKICSIPILHLWQEDIGFRKNRILNRAITFSNSGHLIFIDGDCIPHKAFVKEHFLSRRNNTCFTGRRVNLSDKFSKLLDEEKVKNGFLEKNFYKLVRDGITGNSFDVEKGIYLKNKMLRWFFNKKKRGLLGCNFSIHKSDLLKINGFDERYEAPSVGEDSDVEYRLSLAKIEIKSLNNIAVQYHLHHKLLERPVKNLELFERIKKEGNSFTNFGIERR